MTSLGRAGPDGPLPILLLALTFVTGMVDAVSFLALGRVFVANMTGLASESTLAGGSGPHQRRRIGAALAMLAGAALGAAIVLGVGLAAALVVTWLTIAANGVVGWRLARSTEAWTVAT